MGIEYLDKTHAKLVVTRGSGAQRERRVKRITYKNKKDAERQYREFLKDVDFGVDSSMTVARLLDWYIQQFADNGGKETTERGYRTAAKYLKKHLGTMKAKNVTLGHIEVCIEKMDASPKTVKNRISLLRSAYKSAIRRGLLNNKLTLPCEHTHIYSEMRPLHQGTFQTY